MGIEESRICLFPQNPEALIIIGSFSQETEPSNGISMLTLADDPGCADRLGEPFSFSRDLFLKARKSITDGYLTDYPVISSDGRTVFYLHVTKRNMLCESSNTHLAFPAPDFYSGENLIKELDQLDLTLLSAFDGYVFDGLEEYTFALTELILSLWPERPVWFRDPRAAMFWEDEKVRILPKNDDSELPQDRNLMNVLTRRTFHLCPGRRAEKRHFFDSIQVMASLCWARKTRKLGEKNPEKTIFLIDVSAPSAGIGDLVKIVQAYAGVARERGWTPVAWLHNTQYSDDPGTDLWREWFAPLSDVTLEDALHSARVILGKENGTSVAGGTTDSAWNPYLEYYLKGPTLRLSDELSRRYENSFDVRPDENSLGVVIRGSDLLAYIHSGKRLVLDELIERVTMIRTEGHFSKVFLATEEEESLAAFQSAMGEDLLFVEQKRIRGYKMGDPLIWKRLRPPRGERMAWGEKYLYILWCLSHCESLVYNVYCGAVEMALRLKEGRGEQYRLILEI